jgi:hypothetical protein
MADDASGKSEPEIVEPADAAPPVREPRHDPGVIEGEATEIHEPAPPEPPPVEAAGEEPAVEPASEQPGAEPANEEPAAEPAADADGPEIRLRTRSSAFPFVAGALGAVVGAALALGAAWFVDPRAAALDAASLRWAALERGVEAQAAANADFGKRLGALEASEAGAAKAAALEALGRRVAALEGAAGKDEAAQAALSEARAARADAAKALALAAGAGQTTPAPAPAPVQGAAPAPFDASALEARIGGLEGDLAALKASQADVGALGDRLSKMEAALAAPKSEARLAAAEVAPNRDGAAAAILAISLNERLNAGAPFAEELAALARLGADGGKVSALKPFADAGAPTLAALGAAFAKIAPAVVAAATPPSSGGMMDRLFDHLRGLVRVRKVGEVGGDDETLVSNVSAALAHGDLDAAIQAYGRLPDAARLAGRDWVDAAQARRAAGAAALSLRADAILRLAAAKD